MTFTGELSPSPVPTASLKSSGEGATPPPHLPPVEQQQVLNAAAETPASQVEDGNTQQSSGNGEESPPLEDRGEVQLSNTQLGSTKGTVQQSNGDAAPPSVNDLQEQAPHLGDSGQNQNSHENHQVGETG